MAASVDSGDSSSEDENHALFREAAIDSAQLFSWNMESGNKSFIDGKMEKRPSLRPDSVTVEENDFLLDTTPGFRKHVSKKLGKIIDSQIDEVNTETACQCPTTQGEGIKLFASSTKFVLTEEEMDKIQPVKRRKKYSSSSDNSSDEEKFAEAAVSHDFIMKESFLNQAMTNSASTDNDKIHQNGVESKTLTEKSEDITDALTEKSEDIIGKSSDALSSKATSNCKKKKKKRKKEKYDLT